MPLPHIICTPSHGPLALVVNMITGNVLHSVEMPTALTGKKNRPFGITRGGQGEWYIADHDAIAFLDHNLQFQRAIFNLPDNLHQIQYDAVSGEIWVVATTIDSLLVINPQTQSIRRFCLLSDQWIDVDAPGKDTHHFNSIRWVGEHCYIVAHNHGKNPSAIRTYNRAMQRIGLWYAGKESHSVVEHEGKLYVIDSRGGRIVCNDNRHFPVCETPLHYARGMAVTDDGIAIIAAFRFGDAPTRTTGDAYLRAFDLSKGELLQEVLLSEVGNIQDIQLWKLPA